MCFEQDHLFLVVESQTVFFGSKQKNTGAEIVGMAIPRNGSCCLFLEGTIFMPSFKYHTHFFRDILHFVICFPAVTTCEVTNFEFDHTNT